MQAAEQKQLLATLEARFASPQRRHPNLTWAAVSARLDASPSKLAVLAAMEGSGGEPDVIGAGADGAVVFCDCAAESPAGRRSSLQ